MGFINPDEGNIYCENKNIELNYDGWIKNKLRFSKVFLFNDTIEKNICLNFDDGKIDKERLEKAIEIAELKQKIFSLKINLMKKLDQMDQNYLEVKDKGLL